MITAVNPKITRVSPLFMFHGKEHKRLLALYMAVVVLHACEHILQLYQFAVLGWARPASGGLLGLWAPQLAMSELLHFGYNSFQLVGLLALLGGFKGRARTMWIIATCLQGWHWFEHALIQMQWITKLYLYNGPKQMSVLEILLPRIELHFLYNMIVLIPTVIAVYPYARKLLDARRARQSA
jgi:hypothetical protein